jgi:serine protease Do
MFGIKRDSISLAAAAALLLAGLSSVPAAVATEPGSSDLIAGVVAKVSSSVVRIVVVRPPKPEADKPEVKLAGASAEKTTTAIGSGFVIDPSGYIATNKHVVEDAISVFVATADGVRYPATIVGMPDKADMALIRVDAGRMLPAVQFGDSDKMRVGDTVVAIGSPFGFDNSVTAGIVSAVNRDIMESPFDDYLQTDAAINHGNSGGPLFNLAGEVIGMNSVIFAPGPGSIGLGFAVPSNELRFVFDRLMKTGEVRAGMLPIHTQQVSWMLEQALYTSTLQGALVAAIHDDGDKMLEGKVKPGDVIVSFNGQPVLDPRDLARKAAQAPIGSDAALELDRGGDRETVHVKIHAWPEAKRPSPPSARQKLGLELISTRSDNGDNVVTVGTVDPNGSAADSGIQKGDIILEVQRIPVSDPQQALRIFKVQSFNKHLFAAVLMERDKKRSWIPMAVPPDVD